MTGASSNSPRGESTPRCRGRGGTRARLYFCAKVITPLGPDRARNTVYWQHDAAGWLARLMPASTLAKLALTNLEHEFELLAGARVAAQVEALQALRTSR
jgi:hypothetical protein